MVRIYISAHPHLRQLHGMRHDVVVSDCAQAPVQQTRSLCTRSDDMISTGPSTHPDPKAVGVFTVQQAFDQHVESHTFCMFIGGTLLRNGKMPPVPQPCDDAELESLI
jgi:hypothetical protein